MRLVVADSSPLIALASSGYIDVLLAIIEGGFKSEVQARYDESVAGS